MGGLVSGPLQDNFCPFLLLVIFTECLLFQCRYSVCGVLPIDFMPSWMTRTEEKELAYLTKYLHKYLRLSRMRKGWPFFTLFLFFVWLPLQSDGQAKQRWFRVEIHCSKSITTVRFKEIQNCSECGWLFERVECPWTSDRYEHCSSVLLAKFIAR